MGVSSMDKSQCCGKQVETLVDLLRWRAADQPDQDAYSFLVDGETQEVRITYGELDAQARALAARLQEWERKGSQADDAAGHGRRALMVFPPGMEFIGAFFGC